MTTKTSPLFDEVVSVWDEPPLCQTEQNTEPCQNPAQWLAVRHQPCGHKLLCDHHLTRWLLHRIANPGGFACSACDRYFTDLDVFARFVRL